MEFPLFNFIAFSYLFISLFNISKDYFPNKGLLHLILDISSNQLSKYYRTFVDEGIFKADN